MSKKELLDEIDLLLHKSDDNIKIIQKEFLDDESVYPLNEEKQKRLISLLNESKQLLEQKTLIWQQVREFST